MYPINYIILFLIFITKISYSQEFQKSIAMHGSAERPYSIERDTKVNKHAPTSKILKLGHVGTFNSLNPYIIKGISPPGIKGLVIESLMNWSPDEPFSLYPGIAEAIRVDKKRTWVEFKINKNAKFSNNEKISPEDIEFSLNILRNHGRPHTRSYYSLVEKTEITSKTSIKFFFKKESNFEMPLIIGLMPVLSKKYWKYKDFQKTTLKPFISSGPYFIEKIIPGRSIVYKKNPNWWNKNSNDSLGRYNFKFIKYDFYRDTNIALEAFLSGEYDIHIENDAIRWKQAYKNVNINKKTFPKKSPSGIEAIMFNSRLPPLNNSDIRTALSLMFPYNFINKILNHNLLKRTYGPWDNSELSADDKTGGISINILIKYNDDISKNALKNIKKYENNERKRRKEALELLNSNGWKLINGKMTNEQSKSILEFEIITNQS